MNQPTGKERQGFDKRAVINTAKRFGSIRVLSGHKHFGVFVGLFLMLMFIPR
jgi:hypothetical protein